MATECIAAISALRERIGDARRSGLRIGCVPTMGALHAGHTALLDAARPCCDLLVATLFVNPLQFDRQDDLRDYPRDLETDLRVCSRHGADILFAPRRDDMYPRSPTITLNIEGLADGLCGAHRPGHFQGVATVVLKLLNIVQPDIAWFGEKDFQQLVIVRRIVADTNLPVRIESVETVREPDGLAVSSRNVHLAPDERAAAPLLAQSLRNAQRAIKRGETDARALCQRGRELFNSEPLLRLEYFEIVNPDTLAAVDRVTGPVRIVGAAHAGATRLIDNFPAWPPEAR